MAVNLIRSITEPQRNVVDGVGKRKSVSPLAVWHVEAQGSLLRSVGTRDSSIQNIEHFIGGPCQPDEPLAVLDIPEGLGDKEDVRLDGLAIGKTKLFRGSLTEMAELAHLRWKKTQMKSTLKIFWGYAAWGSTQILAELAKRHWGLVLAD